MQLNFWPRGWAAVAPSRVSRGADRVGVASTGPAQEGSKALLQFGADFVRCPVGNLLHAIREQIDPLSLPKQCQGLNASAVRCGGASLPLQAFQNKPPSREG